MNYKIVIKFWHDKMASFTYFYKKIGYKIWFKLILNIIVGILDGLGLTMFFPLFQIVGTSNAKNTNTELGKPDKVLDAFNSLSLDLNITNILLIMCVFFFLKGIFLHVNNMYDVRLRQQFVKNLRMNLISLISNTSYKSFVLSDVGRIQNTMTGEVGYVIQSYKLYFSILQQFIMVAVYMFFAFFIDANFAILMSIGAILSTLIFVKVYALTKKESDKLTIGNSEFQGLVIQYIAFYKYLKATATNSKLTQKMSDTINNIDKNQLRLGFLDSIVSSSRESILIFVVCLVISIEVLFLNGKLALILLSLVFFYRAMSSILQMQIAYNGFLAVSGSLKNMTSFEQELEVNQETDGVVKLDKFSCEIILKDASFLYGMEYILKDINLKIMHHETTAFIGESGSGKTTLVNIISGLMPLNSGTLLIDGKDSTTLNKNSYQKRIGYISQDSVIFNDTIFNNVTLWDSQTEENYNKFVKVLELAACYEYVFQLPLKENTLLGNNGINMSGGQKQRISIARELYKDVDILVLDEATSALDSETEKSIQKSIENIQGNYTIFIIAHRLSTITKADKVVLLEKGKIIASGTFTEVKEQSKKFRRMLDNQSINA